MKFGQAIVAVSVDHPKLIAAIMVVITLGLGALIPLVEVDTDPENMLPANEAVRVFHNAVKKDFALYDLMALGVVNEKDPDGVFNPTSLARVYELTEFAKGLRWPRKDAGPGELPYHGVIEYDLMAPSTVDHVEGASGAIRFSWLMPKPPATREEAQEARRRLMSNPLFKGTLVSEDGQALCLYLPLTSKDQSHRVYTALRERIAKFQGDERYFITGLPVAEDVFGKEMFVQMAISAPLAMLCVFLLKLAFFRRVKLIISPLLLAAATVVQTMGMMIGMGYTVHIMSSMIPIFLMPYSVVDSVHILSDFFDRYQATRDRRKTVVKVFEELFSAMLYTSLTTVAGFASLALTPIPPVQVFGVFVAIGVLLAWVWTVTFIPAYIMLIPEKSLEGFGATHHAEAPRSWLTRLLNATGRLTFQRAKPILAAFVVLAVVATYGVTRIRINDNPVKWFTRGHPIRVADEALNRHFGGTYMAFLVLNVEKADLPLAWLMDEIEAAVERLQKGPFRGDAEAKAVFQEFRKHLRRERRGMNVSTDLVPDLEAFVKEKSAGVKGSAEEAWYELGQTVQAMRGVRMDFQWPQLLAYVDRLQQVLLETRVVGKANSLSDAVKKVAQELYGGRPEDYKLPDSRRGVAQCLMQYQNSHDPEDLWHFAQRPDSRKEVDPAYRRISVWVQLKSGDNQVMTDRVLPRLEEFFRHEPPPVAVGHDWAGLTYLNVVWQENMVFGMFQSFLGSFLVVFVMMVVLFRSALWGLLSMVPLSLTILVIYGVIGLIGKDYDMPVAVLSALTLGMAVDFAIHFLERARSAVRERGLWSEAAVQMFGEPARAISRNAIVISLGFTPLLLAPLVPYRTVGVFMFSIMAVGAVVTLLLLPALVRLMAGRLFHFAQPVRVSCNCATCFVASAASVALVALNIHQYAAVGWTTLTWASAVAIPVLALACGIISRRRACQMAPPPEEETPGRA